MDLKYIFDSLLVKSKRQNYKNIPNSLKDKYFFIINRFLSKKYLNFSKKFNYNYSTDKSILLDIWYLFLHDKCEYSSFWVWPKKIKKDKKVKFLSCSMKIKESDADFLIKKFPKLAEEEIQYYKLLKNKTKL